MALGFVEQRQVPDTDEASVTGRGLVLTLRCANPDCNHPVAQLHSMGLAIFRVMCCPACGRASEFENGAIGWTAKLLPKRMSALPKQPAGAARRAKV